MSRARIFWACAAFVCVPMIASTIWPTPPAPPRPKETAEESDPRNKADLYCRILWYSPEYRASSAGGDYRHRADELCDELRRQAAREMTAPGPPTEPQPHKKKGEHR